MFVNPSGQKAAFSFVLALALSLGPVAASAFSDDTAPTVDNMPSMLMSPQDEVPLPPIYENDTENPLSSGSTPTPPAEPMEIKPPSFDSSPAPQLTAEPSSPSTEESAKTEEVAPSPEPVAPPIAETPAPVVEAAPLAVEAQPDPETDYSQLSPTAQTEAYQKALKKKSVRQGVPYWSFNMTAAPFAFRDTELRVGSSIATIQKKPRLIGALFSGERMLLRSLGLLSIGVEGGVYPAINKDPAFSGLEFGFFSAGAYAMYQFNYINNQWVVPFIKIQQEGIRHAYRVGAQRVSGINILTRIEAGLLVYLNFIEPGAAGDMYSFHGIKRTYLVGSYTSATDSTKKDFDMSESTYRGGLRFEF